MVVRRGSIIQGCDTVPLAILVVLLIWAAWASVFDGGLKELKQVNPAYAHPDKSVAYLVSQLNANPKPDRLWTKFHVENCSIYMPDWQDAESCVRERLRCELNKPQSVNPIDYSFSGPFRDCASGRKPFMGPAVWVRLSRVLFRFGVSFGAMWVGSGFALDADATNKWAKNNPTFSKSLMRWTEDAK